MAKLERKAYMTYIDSSFGDSTGPKWYLIGKDIEDMSVELSADVETVKNILGETSVKDNGFEPSLSADPYYADKNETNSPYEKLKDIAMNRKKGDSCKTKILEIIIDKDTGPFDAWQEDVVVKPASYGGDTAGFAIPFDIHFDGNRKQGTATITSGVPEFTPPSN